MKKVGMLIIIVFIFATNNYSKDINGTVIFKNDSVINVTLKVPFELKLFSNKIDFIKIQKGIKYYDSNRLVKKFKPNQVKEIRFNYDSVEYRYISLILKSPPPFVFKHKLLLMQATEGKMNHYLYFKKVNVTMPMGTNPAYSYTSNGQTYNVYRIHNIELPYTYNVLQINGGELFVSDWFNEFKSICKYIDDCPELVKKINNETYDARNINEIVKDYNQCYE